MMKTLKLIILQLFIYTTVSATTYYVSPHGDNANNGMSEDQPFKVVQYAIEQMTSGDILIVMDGIYTGTLKLKSGITIQANNPRNVIFSGAESLSGLNLIPRDSSILGGVEPHDTLRTQEVCCLNAYRGAYDVNGEYWYPGSDWMPYGLPVLKTMAEAEQFAQKYKTISIVPQINIENLKTGQLDMK